MPDISELLAQVPLLSHLSADDLSRLSAQVRPQSFDAGHDIVEIGTPGRSLYLIVSGDVRVVYPSPTHDFELARLGTGDFFGEMALLNDKPRSATVRAVDYVQTLALDKDDFRRIVVERPHLALELLEIMSIRIRNADEQISGLSDRAMRDPLTELPNRRAFRERVIQEIDLERRYGTPFSIVLLDVDEFRGINDTLGYDAGDELLIWVGRILLEHTRACDTAFRIGGEEFAVLCPSTGADTARTAADRLVALVSEARTPQERGIRLTLSGGYASCPEHASSLEGLQRLAERGTQRAKQAGRNQIADPPLGKDADEPDAPPHTTPASPTTDS